MWLQIIGYKIIIAFHVEYKAEVKVEKYLILLTVIKFWLH